MLRRVRIIRRIRSILALDSKEEALFRYFKCKQKQTGSSDGTILVQCVENPFYFGLFGQIAISLKERENLLFEQYILRSLNPGETKSFLQWITFRLVMNPLFNHKWSTLYSSFCEKIAYSSTSFHPVCDLIDLSRAWICWRSLSDRKSLIDLVIDGIPVGDLINDSYLRFKPAPTLDRKDPYLLILLWQTYRDIRRAQSYFSKVRPKIYLTSYSTYIQHGIPVRVALKHGVRVYSFGIYQEFAKELRIDDWFHARNTDHYAEEFMKMDFHEQRLAAADEGLRTRLSGGVDNATSYMRQSAYAESGVTVPDVKGAAVVFLHDFYDSPHVYPDMVFPDFWDWACFTIETLTNAGIQFFVKPHPNQIDLNNEVLNKLERLYPDMRMISPGVTNKQLVDAGMACGITVYGTVAHEMAYMGIPTVSCARHPHVSFDFCITARNKEEYAKVLQHCTEIKMDKSSMKKQSLMFYYMHNLCNGDENQSLRDAVMKFRNACAAPGEVDNDFVKNLDRIAGLPGYKYYLFEWTSSLRYPIRKN